jgi:hypothetical protein
MTMFYVIKLMCQLLLHCAVRYNVASNVTRLSSFSFHTELYIRRVYADNLNTTQPIRNDTCG